MSLDGSVCFFVLYHYESNAILAPPVAGLDDKSMYKAYKMQFDNLTSKGYKPKINIMDNQATKHIKAFLMEQQCQLQLVEPHNHRLNAAERAIQTFKDACIAALATTDSDFPLQLWDKIAPQVQDMLNSLTAISCYGGEKHRNPVEFYSRNSTESTLQDKHNNHKHHHHGGSVCPSFGVGSMDPPDRTRVTSSEEVGQGGGVSVLIKSINF
jgi:hypothetical protein